MPHLPLRALAFGAALLAASAGPSNARSELAGARSSPQTLLVVNQREHSLSKIDLGDQRVLGTDLIEQVAQPRDLTRAKVNARRKRKRGHHSRQDTRSGIFLTRGFAAAFRSRDYRRRERRSPASAKRPSDTTPVGSGTAFRKLLA